VSATNVWMVQATASWLGLDENRVIAIRTEVEGGRLTDRLVPPVPCREGKLQAIDRWIGRRPDLACGDGLGDLPMLEGAAHPLAVGQRAQPDGALLEIAARRGWPVHRF
jgi:phosphoserine phosphatase